MSKDLNIAMQNAIGDLGTDVLKSPYLVNILQDYGAFDVHDKDSIAIKQRLNQLVKDGLVEEVASWRRHSDKKIQREELNLLKRYNNADDVRFIIDSVLRVCGRPCLSMPTTSPTNTVPSQPTPVATKSKTTQAQQANSADKLSGKNIGCALFGLLVFLPCGFILLSISEIGGGLVCMIGAIICIIGPFTNPDFWRWNGY